MHGVVGSQLYAAAFLAGATVNAATSIHYKAHDGMHLLLEDFKYIYEVKSLLKSFLSVVHICTYACAWHFVEKGIFSDFSESSRTWIMAVAVYIGLIMSIPFIVPRNHGLQSYWIIGISCWLSITLSASFRCPTRIPVTLCSYLLVQLFELCAELVITKL